MKKDVSPLTFREPCNVIYSYNKSQRDALFLKFILIKNSTCFGQNYCPSGVLVLYSQQLLCVIMLAVFLHNLLYHIAALVL